MAKGFKFHMSDYLDNPEVTAAYLTEAFESDDVSFISAAISDIARTKGMTDVDDGAGLALETVLTLLNSVGVQIVVEPAERAKAQ